MQQPQTRLALDESVGPGEVVLEVDLDDLVLGDVHGLDPDAVLLDRQLEPTLEVVLLAGLLAPGMSQILFTRSIREAGASRTSVVVGSAPLLAVALHLFLLDDADLERARARVLARLPARLQPWLQPRAASATAVKSSSGM